MLSHAPEHFNPPNLLWTQNCAYDRVTDDSALDVWRHITQTTLLRGWSNWQSRKQSSLRGIGSASSMHPRALQRNTTTACCWYSETVHSSAPPRHDTQSMTRNWPLAAQSRRFSLSSSDACGDAYGKSGKAANAMHSNSRQPDVAAVASLGLVSPGAATDGVTLFFLEKIWRHFSSHRPLKVMTFLAAVSSSLPSSPVVYPVSF